MNTYQVTFNSGEIKFIECERHFITYGGVKIKLDWFCNGNEILNIYVETKSVEEL